MNHTFVDTSTNYKMAIEKNKNEPFSKQYNDLEIKKDSESDNDIETGLPESDNDIETSLPDKPETKNDIETGLPDKPETKNDTILKLKRLPVKPPVEKLIVLTNKIGSKI